ncbi:MAG: class I SAM-dependent methyltransferase [bacterium]
MEKKKKPQAGETLSLPTNSDDQARAWSESAARYADEFLDPFRDHVDNPLLKLILEIDPEKARQMHVADLGCGTGPLLPHLLERFGKVYALDFAEEMLAACRKRLGAKKAAKVAFLNRAMHELDDLGESLDLAFSVNSLVMPDLRVVDKTLRKILQSLRPGGQFMGVVPSVDGIHHHTLMLWDAYLDAGYAMDEAERLVATHMEHHLYDFSLGRFQFGELYQKFWQPDELKYHLKKAGFTDIRLVKLEYPWDDSLAGYKQLKEHPRTWDWTFTATRA